MNTLRNILATLIVIALAAAGCNDGALEIRHSDGVEDAGIADDANGVEPSDDTGANGTDDVGTDDVGTDDVGTDDGGDNNGEPPPPPCDVGEFECVSDTGYQVCVDDGAGSAEWSDESCSGGQLCADTADDLGDICQTCPEDEFAPDNHTSPNAPTLSSGDTFSNLRLCEDPDGQNFFYLGETDSVDVHLEWDDEADALSMDVWVADSGGVDWDGRDWYSAASESSYEAQASEALSPSRHVYVRVYFRSGAVSSGVPYTISRSN